MNREELGVCVAMRTKLPLTAGEFFSSRSEGEILAERLAAAGVEVEQMTFDGVTHEFFGMGAVVPQAQEAVDMASANLRGAFGEESVTDAGAPAQAAPEADEGSDVEAPATPPAENGATTDKDNTAEEDGAATTDN